MEIIYNTSSILEEAKKNAISLKTVLLGNTKSGKTTFSIRLSNQNYNKFLEKFPINETIGAIGTTFATFFGKLNNDYYKFVLWDVPGNEKYRPLSRIFYRDADVIIIFYNSLTRDNFNYLKIIMKK